MKTILLLLTLMTLHLSAQTSVDVRGPGFPRGRVSYAPLALFTSDGLSTTGGGRIVPFHDGEMLLVGKQYVMVALPNPGFSFTGWTKVNVFTFTEHVVDASGNATVVSTRVLSPLPGYIRQRTLKFTAEPGDMILDIPGVETVTRSIGWQADFARSKNWFP